MRHFRPHHRHLLAAIAAAALLSACGTSRDLQGDRPLCQRCHGGASGNAAPPASTRGATATTDVSVGAHQAHVVAGRLRGPIACAECHVVPADMAAHEAGIAAIAAGTASRVTFGPLADKGTPVAAWDRGTARCANTYCHGATIDHGGTNQEPTWTAVDPGHAEAACGTCHGFPPVSPLHPALTLPVPLVADPCNGCHPTTTTGTIDATGFPGIDVAAGNHVNGVLDIDPGLVGLGCTFCHATGAPPPTGAHLAHSTAAAVADPGTAYGDTAQTFLGEAGTAYTFGCGNCHPVSSAFHIDGEIQVTLDPSSAPGGSLRALNDGGAAFEPITGTCSGVYCHSSGQATPAFTTTPGWTSGTDLGCDGCHANPPAYANGGAGTATANGHVARLDFAGEITATGHFAGLPAALHQGSAHGGGIGTQFAGDSAAPITCQACHYRTTDPANTGPSGFYYLDTTGTYDVAGASGAAIVVACGDCHDGATVAAGTGRVMPYFHVNGARDVDFDPRDVLSIPGTLTLPAGPDAPTRPYWYSGATTNQSGFPYSLVGDAVAASAVPGIGLDGTTLSLELTAASWDPAAKSCSSVACHLGRLTAGSQPVQWGQLGSAVPGVLDPAATCGLCHTN